MNLLKKLFKLGRDIDYDHAIDCYNKNLYRESIELFSKVLQKKSPASGLYRNLAHVYIGQAHRNLGIMLFAMGNFQTALQHLQESLRFNPDYLEVYHLIGICQNNIGDFSGAVATFNNILKLDPVNLPIKLKLGVSLHNLKMWDKAVATYTAILTQQPRYADVYYYLGIVHAGRGALPQAIAVFKKALSINPSYKDARIKLGILYCHSAAYDQALDQFQKASQIDPSDNNLATLLEAINSILATSRFSEDEISAALNQCFGGDKPIAQAIQEFNRHIKIMPDFSDILSLMQHFPDDDASLCSMLVPLLTDYLSQYPNYPDLHNALGTLFMKLKKYADAETAFRTALGLNPSYMNAQINLLEALRLQGKTAEALEQGSALLTQHPNRLYPDVCCTIAEMQLSAGQDEEAQQCISTALRINPQYCYAHYLQGKLYELQNNTSKASQSYRQCLSCKPSPEIAQEVERRLTHLFDT